MTFRKTMVLLTLVVCLAALSGCPAYKCAGRAEPCPKNENPPKPRCDLPGIYCTGCPKYLSAKGYQAIYCTECYKNGGIGGSDQLITEHDSRYVNCPKCDATQCLVDGYWTQTTIRCGERKVAQCNDVCTYGSFTPEPAPPEPPLPPRA